MFLPKDIDRAIVMTQYDLRGFNHPLRIRLDYMENPKSLAATICNLVAFAAGLGDGKSQSKSTYHPYADSSTCTFDEYLAMCQQLFKDCEGSQKEAIQIIVAEMLKQVKQMTEEVASGKRNPSNYIKPIEKDNYLGKVLISLATTFEVELPTPVSV